MNRRSLDHPAEPCWISPDGKLFLLPEEHAAYHRVVQGERHRVPNGFWDGDDGYQRGLACLRYGVEVLQQVTEREAIRALIADQTLRTLQLAGWKLIHHVSAYTAFAATWSEHDFRPWECTRVPYAYWQQHGDPARIAALRWWLEREGLSVPQLIEHLERRTLNLIDRLEAWGLSTLPHAHDGWSLARLLDPSLPPERPSQRAARRRLRRLRCPRRELRAIRFSGPWRAATDGPRWITEGLSLPRAWWPRRAPYARVVARNGQLRLIPMRTPTSTTFALRRVGTRWFWRMDRPHAEQLAAHSGPLQRDGTRIGIPIADPAILRDLARVFHHPRASHGPDLRVGRDWLLISPHLWPLRATQAALGFDAATTTLTIVPIDATGAVIGSQNPQPSPRSKRECYALHYEGQRILLAAGAFLRAQHLPIGAWRWQERDAHGVLSFVPLEPGRKDTDAEDA